MEKPTKTRQSLGRVVWDRWWGGWVGPEWPGRSLGPPREGTHLPVRPLDAGRGVLLSRAREPVRELVARHADVRAHVLDPHRLKNTTAKDDH